MVVAKKAAKKVTKRVTKKTDNVYWVIQERSKLFSWKAHSLYATYEAAKLAKATLETNSPLSFSGYKLERVLLQGV